MSDFEQGLASRGGVPRRYVFWLLWHSGEHTGPAEAIWRWMLGGFPNYFADYPPKTALEFEYCAALLGAFPEWRDRLPLFANSHSVYWERVVESWDLLVAMHNRAHDDDVSELLRECFYEDPQLAP